MTSSDRIVVSKTVSSSKAVTENNSTLKLMMICCEENPPYGPSEDTAVMFLELLCQAYEWKCSRSTFNQEQDKSLTISITVYHAQSQDYPTTTSEWSGYDGIIIPGSLSAAYDTHVEWVGQLQSMIRTKIHEMRVKTLAVCFGHQTFAHAFGGGVHGSDEGGRAVKCPTGSKVGRIPSNLTPEGRHLLLLNEDGNNINSTTEFHMEMLYTHGDMVHSIPEFAVTLGGNEKVPIEACAYFSTKEERILFQQQQQQQSSSREGTNETAEKVVTPYAFTFQAHPEYISSTGFKVNYVNTVRAIQNRGYISKELSEEVCEDAKVNFEKVQEDSLSVMIAVATAFGWF